MQLDLAVPRSRALPSLSSLSLWLATGYILLLVVVVIAPGLFTSASPTVAVAAQTLQPPSAAHWFGTDLIGRDVYAMVIYGARYSMLIGLGAMTISMVGGFLIGMLAALGGRAVDEVLTRLLDTIAAFPAVLLALLVVALTQPGVVNVAVAVGIAFIPRYGRLIRGETLLVRNSDFVRHAVIYGRSRWRIVARHVVPNVLRIVPVLATLDIGISIMTSSGLSFLGLGPQPPTPEWGVMLANSLQTLQVAWWTGIFPGAALTLAVISFTVLGRRAQQWLAGAQQ